MKRASAPANFLNQARDVEALLRAVSPSVLGARLRRARIRSGQSIRDLAAAAGVNKNSILHVEGGGAAQPLTVLKICSALGLHVATIAGPDSPENDVVAVHHASNDRWYDMEDMAAGPIEGEAPPQISAPMMMLQSRLETGQMLSRVVELRAKTETRTHPGEELVYVLEGRVEVIVGEERNVLATGEAAAFWSSEPHSYAPQEGSARILIVMVPHGSPDIDLP